MRAALHMIGIVQNHLGVLRRHRWLRRSRQVRPIYLSTLVPQLLQQYLIWLIGRSVLQLFLVEQLLLLSWNEDDVVVR